MTTVGTLRREMEKYDDDTPIIFGCKELTFHRVKNRGSYLQVEFEQTVYKNSDGKFVVIDLGSHSNEYID